MVFERLCNDLEIFATKQSRERGGNVGITINIDNNNLNIRKSK